MSIQPAGQTEQSVPAGTSYALALADGRVSAKADCNVCGGNLVVGGQALTIGPLLACTRAACPTMAFENTYVAILAGDSAARIDGNSLTLTSSRGMRMIDVLSVRLRAICEENRWWSRSGFPFSKRSLARLMSQSRRTSRLVSRVMAAGQ